MNLKAQIEAVIYVAEEPATLEQIRNALNAQRKAEAQAAQPAAGESPAEEPAADGAPALLTKEEVETALRELIADYRQDARGIEIKEVAGGYRMATKAEHHDVVRAFARALKPPVKLSLAALETLAVIAYRQPVTIPEIQEVRGVSAVGVMKTLLDKKLITTAGRKNVIGRPILYRTSKEFLLQFGLKDLSDLPSLKEFEELARAEVSA